MVKPKGHFKHPKRKPKIKPRRVWRVKVNTAKPKDITGLTKEMREFKKLSNNELTFRMYEIYNRSPAGVG